VHNWKKKNAQVRLQLKFAFRKIRKSLKIDKLSTHFRSRKSYKSNMRHRTCRQRNQSWVL